MRIPSRISTDPKSRFAIYKQHPLTQKSPTHIIFFYTSSHLLVARQENDDILREELLNELEHGVNNEMPTTSFREVAMNRNIPEVYFYRQPHEESNELPQEVYYARESLPIEHFRGNTYGDEVDRKNYPAKESGVYTEGGVVYLPNRGNHESG